MQVTLKSVESVPFRAGARRGTLWVLDHLVDTGRLKPEIAANSLAQMISGGAFLPVAECAKRIRTWSGSD
jgi:hypothetical protein